MHGDPRSTEPADLALEEGPGRGAELGFPALIETAAELRAESVHVGGIEHQSARGELRLELAVEIIGVGALQRDVLLHVALHHLLHVSGQAVPEPEIGEQVEPRPHVVRDRDVAGDLVELVHLGDDERVLLAVDAPRLQRIVEIADVHRHRLRFERGEEVAKHLTVGHAHLDPAQVIGRADRAVHHRDMPKAVLEQPVLEAVDAFRRALAPEILAERAVVCAVHLRVAGKRERQPLDLRDRHLAAEDAAHQGEELELARLQHFERGRVGAGDVVVLRIDGDREPAVGLLPDLLPQIGEELLLVALRRLVVELLRLPLRRALADGRHGTCRPDAGRSPGEQKLAAPSAMLVHRNLPQANGYHEPSPGLACDAATPRPADRLAPGQLAHRGDQVFELERLLERLRGADQARDLEHVVIPQRLEAGHGDDLHLGKLLAQFVDRLDALLFRHEDVGDDHVGRPGALQRQPLNAVGGAFGFDAVALKPLQRKLPEVVVVVDDENARHVPGKGRRNADSMQSAPNNPQKAENRGRSRIAKRARFFEEMKIPSARRGRRKARSCRPGPASPASARGSRQLPRDLLDQSSVNTSQATLSQTTLSHTTLSHTTLSHTTLSHTTLSQTTLSQSKLSQATLFQTRESQLSRDQKMPPSSGSCHCSGEPKRTGYSARAKPSAGRSPRLAQATGVGLESVPTRNPPDRSPGLGAASHGTARVAAFASSSPLPSAIGSGRTWPLSSPYGCVVPTRSALT